MIERRHPPRALAKSSVLPLDYTTMVTEVMTAHFSETLAALEGHQFLVRGEIFADEIVLQVSLIKAQQIWATSFFASVDFEPKASAPTAQDLLAMLVDAIGSVLTQFGDPKDLEHFKALTESSLAGLEDIPFEWTEIKGAPRKIFVRMDKSNPALDQEADQWLKKHDPLWSEREKEEHEATEELFVTGAPGAKKRRETLH